MPSLYTSSLRLEKQGTGENNGTWGQRLNENTIDLIDDAISGVNTFNVTTGSDLTLTVANGDTDEARKPLLVLNGQPTANINLIVPSVPKKYEVDATGLIGTKTVTVKTSSGTGVSFSAGDVGGVYCNGTDIKPLLKNLSFSSDFSVTENKVDLSDVGSLKVWPGIKAPARHLFAFGQELNRTTYANLFNVLTVSFTGNTTSGSTTITGVSIDLTTGASLVGAKVECVSVPTNTTVVSVTPTTITLSAAATATATGLAVRILPHGAGDGTTTFHNVDMRGRLPLGLDNMGGTAAGRVSIATTLGVTGGTSKKSGSTDGHSLTEAEGPRHSHVLYGTRNTPSGPNMNAMTGASSITSLPAGNAGGIGYSGNGDPHSHTITDLDVMNPFVAINWIIKY